MPLLLSLIDDDTQKDKFDTIYHSFRHRLFLIARRYTQNDADAEDILQDTFFKIAENISKVSDDPHKAFSFCSVICKNTALNFCRDQKCDLPLEQVDFFVSDRKSASDIAEQKQQESDLMMLFAQLPEKYKNIQILYFVHGYSLKTISKLLDIPYNTVKQQFSRGKAKLRNELEKLEKGEITLEKIKEA